MNIYLYIKNIFINLFINLFIYFNKIITNTNKLNYVIFKLTVIY